MLPKFIAMIGVAAVTRKTSNQSGISLDTGMRAKRIYIMLATQQNIIERSLRLAIEFNTEGQRLRDDKTDVNPYTAALLWNLAEVNTGHNRARNN